MAAATPPATAAPALRNVRRVRGLDMTALLEFNGVRFSDFRGLTLGNHYARTRNGMPQERIALMTCGEIE
jgi:hypothetical protein